MTAMFAHGVDLVSVWVSEGLQPRQAFPPHVLLILWSRSFALNATLGTAVSSPTFWRRFVPEPRSSHLNWSWSNTQWYRDVRSARSFCTLNGSALTITWAWPLSGKSFQYYYLWRAKHLLFASVSKVLWRGSRLQVHVKEAVRYSILENTWTSENQTLVCSLTFLLLFYKK